AEIRVGRIPESRRDLPPPRPILETRAVGGALLEEVLGAGKALGVGPHAREPIVGARDEILEVAFPAAVVIRKEEQIAGSGDHDPTGEVNRPEGPEKPG